MQHPIQRAVNRFFPFACLVVLVSVANAAGPDSPVGKTFWVGSTGAHAQPIGFISRAEAGYTAYGQTLKNGQTFEVRATAKLGERLQYRIVADDGRELFIDADDFELALFTAKKYRDLSADAFSWDQHLFTGPPEPLLQKAAAAAKARSLMPAAQRERHARPGARIGMTAAEALKSSWGVPEEVNRTITANGTQEQWVYRDGNYLYFDDGILTAIQN